MVVCGRWTSRCKPPATLSAVRLTVVCTQIDFVYYYRRLLNPSLTFKQQTDTSATRLVSFLESVMEERAVTVPREQVVVHGVNRLLRMLYGVNSVRYCFLGAPSAP